jgi:hypothetical protein
MANADASVALYTSGRTRARPQRSSAPVVVIFSLAVGRAGLVPANLTPSRACKIIDGTNAFAASALAGLEFGLLDFALELGYLSLEREHTRLQCLLRAHRLARHAAESAVDQLCRLPHILVHSVVAEGEG